MREFASLRCGVTGRSHANLGSGQRKPVFERPAPRCGLFGTGNVSEQTSPLPRLAVPAAFDDAAADYDWLVDTNPGYHSHLRRSVQRMRIPERGRGLRLLDAGCGTGASTAALLAAAPEADIVAVDASAGMLRQAAAKRWPPSVRFVHTPIEQLAAAHIEGPFDGIMAAYLMRNLDDPDGSSLGSGADAARRDTGGPRVLRP